MLVSPDRTCFSDEPNKLDFNDILKADPSGGNIKDRFNKAVKAAQLEGDFEQFSNGWKTVIGERGINISGG